MKNGSTPTVTMFRFNFKTDSRKDTIKRKSNTQQALESTKKWKKTSSDEAEVPGDEVIYEGPGEPPLPVQLLGKIETKEEPIQLLVDDELPADEKQEPSGILGNSGNLKLEDFVAPEDTADNVSTTLSASFSTIVSQPSSDSINITKFHHKKTSANHGEDSTSLKEFLLIFRAAAYNLTSPEFADFQKVLREAINQTGNQEKSISFEKIQYALDYALNFVLP